MPRAKQKVYQYNSNGKFLKEFESQSEVRKIYFSEVKGKRPIMRNGKYEILPDNTVISHLRLGREIVKNIIKYNNNPYLNIGYKNDPIKVLNLNKKVIARFASINIASKLTNISMNTIYSQVYQNKTNNIKNKTGLFFRLDK